MRNVLACRIVVKGHPYLLRIGATTLVDPAVELASTRAGAEAGIAPRIWYADAADRVLVTDFIERAPLPDRFGLLVAATIARIHALPPWPKTHHQLDTLERFLAALREAKLRPDADDVFARYAELAAVYPRDSELADLAMAASFFADDDELDYLAAYFGAPPSEYQRARFFLARIANHLSYVAFLSLLAARSGVLSQPTLIGARPTKV